MTILENFTQGPWKYDGNFGVESDVGLPICDLVSDAEINGKTRALPYKANAALIAAAPDMFELLRAVVMYLEGTEDFYLTKEQIISAVENVLAEARGEE